MAGLPSGSDTMRKAESGTGLRKGEGAAPRQASRLRRKRSRGAGAGPGRKNAAHPWSRTISHRSRRSFLAPVSFFGVSELYLRIQMRSSEKSPP